MKKKIMACLIIVSVLLCACEKNPVLNLPKQTKAGFTKQNSIICENDIISVVYTEYKMNEDGIVIAMDISNKSEKSIEVGSSYDYLSINNLVYSRDFLVDFYAVSEHADNNGFNIIVVPAKETSCFQYRIPNKVIEEYGIGGISEISVVRMALEYNNSLCDISGRTEPLEIRVADEDNSMEDFSLLDKTNIDFESKASAIESNANIEVKAAGWIDNKFNKELYIELENTSDDIVEGTVKIVINGDTTEAEPSFVILPGERTIVIGGVDSLKYALIGSEEESLSKVELSFCETNNRKKIGTAVIYFGDDYSKILDKEVVYQEDGITVEKNGVRRSNKDIIYQYKIINDSGDKISFKLQNDIVINEKELKGVTTDATSNIIENGSQSSANIWLYELDLKEYEINSIDDICSIKFNIDWESTNGKKAGQINIIASY